MACTQSSLNTFLLVLYPILLVVLYSLAIRRTRSPSSPAPTPQPITTSIAQSEQSSPRSSTGEHVSETPEVPCGNHVPPSPPERSHQAPKTNRDQSPHAFTSLCDRLLLTHKIRDQEKEVKVLHHSLEEKKQAITRITFAAFTERLLLHNRIWQQERQILELHAACEKLKKTQESLITRSAEKMMVDVRKEGLLEDFVKDLVAEVEASKKELVTLREAHERDIQEINGEWLKDYQSLVKEVDCLKLGQQARLIEQELASETEDSLIESLGMMKRKTEILEEKVQTYEMWSGLSSDASSIYSTPPHSFSSSLSLSTTDPSSRRLSYELDDDDTLADFSISSTSLSKPDAQMFDFLRTHRHSPKSFSGVVFPSDMSEKSLLSNSTSSVPISSRIPGAFHRNQVFFAPSSKSGDHGIRKRRPTLPSLRLPTSVWPYKKKDHMSPTSASVRKALSPSSRARSRRRVKLTIWRP
ncbi:hypothetical protein ONZ45_g674 [Pleurotus djamor]|nr:hypothetical protein ONZ45_g674 [Pleurotus djamor]